MNNRINVVLVLMLIVLCSVACSQADSIWARRDKNIRALYADDVARKIGDVLTIKISEASKVDNKAKRDLKKETDRSTTFGGGPNFPSKGMFDRFLPEQLLPSFNMTAESANELKSKADYKDERSFVDRITVVVVDVLPNRNLVVMGTRNRNIAGDIQIIEVGGIVRPSDIAFDNTVKSEQVADFRLVTKNSGIAAPYTKQGWLGRILDIIWPF
ncbi:MAG: flagellar basal body L-ring protein FlgH [Planctomycetota bacterium]|jgi:flagellar L-ring protein precursor FlgH